MKFRLFGRGSGENAGSVNEAGVSSNGELLTRAFDYSDFNFQTIDAADTAFNHFKPKEGFQFVITGVIVSGNKDIGVNGAILTVYTATTATSTTPLGTPFEIEVPKSTVLPFIVPFTSFFTTSPSPSTSNNRKYRLIALLTR